MGGRAILLRGRIGRRIAKQHRVGCNGRRGKRDDGDRGTDDACAYLRVHISNHVSPSSTLRTQAPHGYVDRRPSFACSVSTAIAARSDHASKCAPSGSPESGRSGPIPRCCRPAARRLPATPHEACPWCSAVVEVAPPRGRCSRRLPGVVSYRRWSRAWPRSAMRSSTSSKPTDRRITPSVIPAACRALGVSRRWVVVAGCVTSDLASPRLFEISTAAMHRAPRTHHAWRSPRVRPGSV